MLSNILDRVAFLSIFLVVTLLPIFFIPFTKIPAEASKSLLLVVGLSVSIISWAAARFSDGKIFIPKSKVLIAGLVIAFATLLSAFFSTNHQVSFFGSMFDVGTFWFLCAGFLLMLFGSLVLQSEKDAKVILFGFMISLEVLFLFQIARYVSPHFLSFGVLGSKTSAPVGTWGTFGFFAGLSSILSVFVLESFILDKRAKFFTYALLIVSIFHIIAVNSLIVWVLVGLFSLFILIYRISTNNLSKAKNIFPINAFLLTIFSLFFFFSGSLIGHVIPSALNLSNIEISPSASTTFSVAKNSLTENPVFGIGANRFNEAWSLWKPIVVNNTQFWDTTFSSGFGFLVTVATNTGILGITAWLFFLLSLFWLFIKYGLNSGTRNNIALLFLVSSLFLFIASIFYSLGIAGIMLAFAFAGFSTGLYFKDYKFEFNFLEDPRKSFLVIMFLVVIMVTTAGLSFKFIERFASVPYFNGALLATDVKKAEELLNKSISLQKNDLYFRTYAQIQLTYLSILSQKQEFSQLDKVEVQDSFDKAVNGAVSAVKYNPENYLNHQMLGVVYTTVGRMGVVGAQEKAIEAYQEASKLNPLNPGLKLAIATEYASLKKNAEARKTAEDALNLAPNYVDVLIFLSNIEHEEGNSLKASEYADRASLLRPNDKSLNDYNQFLKTSSKKTEEVAETKKSE